MPDTIGVRIYVVAHFGQIQWLRLTGRGGAARAGLLDQRIVGMQKMFFVNIFSLEICTYIHTYIGHGVVRRVISLFSSQKISRWVKVKVPPPGGDADGCGEQTQRAGQR